MPSRRPTNFHPTTPISSASGCPSRDQRRPSRSQSNHIVPSSSPPTLHSSSDASSESSNAVGEAWSPSPNQTPADPNSPSPSAGSSSPEPGPIVTTDTMARATPTVKKSHGKTRPPGHIPRPKNPFILFRSFMLRTGQLEVPNNDNRKVSQLAGRMWARLDRIEKARWSERAKTERDDHRSKYPDYKYAPSGNYAYPPSSSTRWTRGRPPTASSSRRRGGRQEPDEDEVSTPDYPLDPEFGPSARRARDVDLQNSYGQASWSPGQLFVPQEAVSSFPGSRRRSSSTPGTRRPSGQGQHTRSVSDEIPNISFLGRGRARVTNNSLATSFEATPANALLEESPMMNGLHGGSRYLGHGGLPVMDAAASTSAAVYSTSSTPGQLPSQYFPGEETSPSCPSQDSWTFGAGQDFSVQDSTNWADYLSTETFLPGMTLDDGMNNTYHELAYNPDFDLMGGSDHMRFNSPESSSSASPPGFMHMGGLGSVSPFSSPTQQLLPPPSSYEMNPTDQTLFSSLPGPSHPYAPAPKEEGDDMGAYYRGGANIFEEDDYMPYPY